MRGQGQLCRTLYSWPWVISRAMDIIRAMNPDMDPSSSPGTDITMSLGDNQVTHVSPLLTASPLQTFFCPQKINHSVSFSFSLPYHTILSLTIIVPVHQEGERTCVFSSQPRVGHLWIACGSFFSLSPTWCWAELPITILWKCLSDEGGKMKLSMGIAVSY